jgi:simple sugar transport system ATP-binding protein
VRIGLEDLTGAPHHAFKEQGVAYLPAARLEQGLIPGLSLSEHFVLAEHPRGLLIDREHAAALARQRIAHFNIKGTPESAVESLSGGNQQRVLLALLRESLSLILLEHPTRGLDIESTIYIWSKLKERCAGGSAILFISSDLDEILQYSDRVLVFFAGEVSDPVNVSKLDVERLGQMIGGSLSLAARRRWSGGASG